MPTYDYECQQCGHVFETFQSMKDKPLKKCPECGGKVRRLIGTGAAVIFKGSGFYETDYKRSSATSTSGGGKASSSDGGKASSEKSETSSGGSKDE